jgi:5,10-methylenetetrahydromethanopterin reductase
MLFGVGLGQETVREIGPLARLADDLGFHKATIVDVPTLMREHNALMTIAALNTQRMLVGQGVTEAYTYHPIAIACASATIREITGGRAFLGIGAGVSQGSKPGTRVSSVQQLREAVQFMRAFTAGEEATYNGRTLHAEWIRRSEWAGTPVPILVACSGVKACELAGELADMALIVGADPDLVRARMSWIERGALRAGRDPSSVKVWVRTQIYVAESKEAAFRETSPYGADQACNFYRSTCLVDNPDTAELRRIMERTYPGILDLIPRICERKDPYQWAQIGSPQAQVTTQQIVDAFLLAGPPAGIRERIHQLGELGVTGISSVLYALEDKRRIMRDIAAEILPDFNRSPIMDRVHTSDRAQ